MLFLAEAWLCRMYWMHLCRGISVWEFYATQAVTLIFLNGLHRYMVGSWEAHPLFNYDENKMSQLSVSNSASRAVHLKKLASTHLFPS